MITKLGGTSKAHAATLLGDIHSRAMALSCSCMAGPLHWDGEFGRIVKLRVRRTCPGPGMVYERLEAIWRRG